MNPVIRLHIDELVLEGFAPADRYAIGAAVQTELARLLADQGVPSRFGTGSQAPIIDAGAFSLAPNARAATVGAQIAQAVYGGLIG